MSVMTKKKSSVRKKTPKKISPFHPIKLAHTIRDPRPSSPLMEFINSLDGELSELDAIREFQNEWCDHPVNDQVVVITDYRPGADTYQHEIRCEICGLCRMRSGRAVSRG